MTATHTFAVFGFVRVLWKVGDGPEGIPGHRSAKVIGGRNEPAQPSIP
jgi:hypothetical protein